jgi:enoyl-CoA hydratase
MSEDNILVGRNGPVTTVTINRPEARNACSVAMVKALHDAFVAFEADADARVAVLTGAGGTFCAGADLKELASGAALGFCWAGEDKGVTRRLLTKPVIAAVSGHAVAAGLALAVWCDLRVADETAVFGVFCRRYGGPMPNGCTVRLPRLIGQSRALDMMLTGRAVDAREAHAIGLANRLVPAGQALVEAERLAEELAALPQAAMLSEGFQAGAGTFVAGAGRHGEGVAR